MSAGLRIARASLMKPTLVAFSPDSIAGLSFWADASQITGLVDGDPVATWPDLSGNSRDATQSTSSARPTYRTAQANGLPVVRFDGVDDYLALAAYEPLAVDGSAVSVFAVAKPTVTGRHLLGTRGGGFIWRVTAASTWSHFVINRGSAAVTGTALVDVWNSYQGEMTLTNKAADTGSFRVGYNGIFSAATAAAPTFLPGTPLHLGTQGGDFLNLFLAGDEAEILIYDSVLSAADRVKVEDYLRAKWATP